MTCVNIQFIHENLELIIQNRYEIVQVWMFTHELTQMVVVPFSMVGI